MLKLTKQRNGFTQTNYHLICPKPILCYFAQKNKPNKFPNLPVEINSETLERKFTTKVLGVTIDDKLSWSKHIDYTASKVAKSIGIICKARKIFLYCEAFCYSFFKEILL